VNTRVFIAQLKAGFHLWLAFYRHSPALIAVLLLRPYLVLLALTAISQETTPTKLLKDVMISVLVVSSIDIVWDLAGNALSLRFLGVLPYLAVAPSSPSIALVLSYIPRYLIESLLKAAEFLPLLALFVGFAPALLNISLIFLLSLLAVLPLLGLSSLVAYSVLASKEETVWLDWLAPLILLVSGAIYPISILPPWVQAVAQLLPTTYLFELVHALTEEGLTGDAITAVALVYLTMSLLLNSILQFLVSKGESELLRRGIHV